MHRGLWRKRAAKRNLLRQAPEEAEVLDVIAKVKDWDHLDQ
jgi:hypothetical protein